ncbi:MAG TPA: PEGA domain-containing protein [Candidatus Bathyarchaeia archaeon]|nr:PEGA domain-containing protein [Candidatus Bathyarchaeia archaeon]
MRSRTRSSAIAITLLSGALCWAAPAVGFAQPGVVAPAPGQGMYIQVRRGGGYIWIPLDSSWNPQIPGSAPSPGAGEPAMPPAPSTPGAPSPPAAGTWGFLKPAVEPAEARLFIDGRDVGLARQFAGPQDFIALGPGLHTVEVRLAGFKPTRMTVEISAARTYLLQLRLAADTDGSSTRAPGDTYESLTSGIPPGGGYIIAPRR